jgi:hypothetical protein
MSLGGGKSQSTTDVRLNAININQSSYGNCIGLLYGQNRVPMTLGWYGNFVATAHTVSQSGGKGGGGGSSNTTYTYTASMVWLLIEGQLGGPMGQIWKDKALVTLSSIGGTLFTGAGGQATWSYLSGNYPSQAVPYDHTAYIGVPNYALGSSAALPNYTFELTGLAPYTVGTINDAEPSAMLTDYCTDANHGANFSGLGVIQGTGVLTYQSYCIAMGFFISPYESTQRAAVDFIKETLQITNSNAFVSAGTLNIVPYADASVTGNGRTYTPNLTPLYSFTDDDFMLSSTASAGSDPVIVDRAALADTFNTVHLEYLNRANAYNTDIAQAKDDQDIALNGVRTGATLTFHQITTGSVARQVAQLILQRQLYIRNTFTFSIRADYCLLEPMDLVSITDSVLGLTNKLVRITEVDDDENDLLTITAEDMLVGTASAPVYNWQASQGYAANYAVVPPSVGTPLIFAAPAALVSANGGHEIWVAVDQGAAGSWGGGDVYMSLDNVSYIYAGAVHGASRYGTLTANLPSNPDPDTTDTLSVALTNAATTSLQLVSGSTADYTNLRTLLYVDGEIMAYQTATLTGTGTYNLTTLRRGLYGSSPAAHLSGAQFARIDAGIFRVPYDPGMIGQTMYFKFASFNVYGGAYQSLAACTAYSHVLASNNAGQLMPSPVSLVGSGVTVVGNNVFKSTNTTAWDSTVNSLQAYTNGAFVSWQPADNTSSTFMMSLNHDPATSSSYTTLDYALECLPGTGLVVYNNGTLIATLGTYAAGDDLAITYDGSFVRYLQNGTVIYQQTAAANQTLYLDSSFNTFQAAANNLKFGPYGTATPVLYIARGTATVANASATKPPGGATAWDSDVYSISGFPTCHLVFKTNNLDLLMGSLVTAIPATPGYMALNYAIYCNGGTVGIYESGTAISSYGSYSSTDVFAITYDGATLTYLKSGTVLRTVAVSGLTLYADILLHDVGAGCNSLEFGPSATIPIIDNPQIGQKAVDPSGGQVAAKGSTPLSVPDQPFTYTSTTTTITITWPAMNLYRADGTVSSIASGSKAITGLSTGTTYKVYPYAAEGSTLAVAWVTSGGSGSPAMCYPAAGKASAAAIAYAQGNIPLNGFQVATTTSGSGGGGGGGLSCPHELLLIETPQGLVKAGDLRVGDHLYTSATASAPILRLAHRPQSAWVSVELHNGETLVVSPDHRFIRADRREVRAADLHLLDILASAGNHLEVVCLKAVFDTANAVQLELPAPHLYLLTRLGPLSHNAKP